MQELVMRHLVFEQRLVVSGYEPGARRAGWLGWDGRMGSQPAGY
jgi:hypothetical protein